MWLYWARLSERFTDVEPLVGSISEGEPDNSGKDTHQEHPYELGDYSLDVVSGAATRTTEIGWRSRLEIGDQRVRGGVFWKSTDRIGGGGPIPRPSRLLMGHVVVGV